MDTYPDTEEASGRWKRLAGGLHRYGFSPLGAAVLLVIAVLPLIPAFSQEYIIRWLIAGCFLAAQAVAFDFTAGQINVVNFGWGAIVGLGAYTSAILANTTPYIIVQPGISPWIGMFIGGLAGGLVGLLLGMLTLRLRGGYAAIMAWFVGIAALGLASNLTSLTRGALGLHPPTLLATADNLPYFYIILVMMIGIYIILWLVTQSDYGLAFKALGQNMEAARASGVSPTKYRVANFTLSCFFAGLLGGFYAHWLASLTPKTVMDTSRMVEVLAIAFIGGRGSLWGGMAVAFPFVILIQILQSRMTDLPGFQLVLYGILMILVMIYYPSGVAGLYDWAAAKVYLALARRHPSKIPPDTGGVPEAPVEPSSSLLPPFEL
jgi:branched-chain amino acid transport system permease protein